MGEGSPPKNIERQGPAALSPAQTELALSDPVRQLDTGQDDAGIREGLETEHAGASTFDGAMVLLDYKGLFGIHGFPFEFIGIHYARVWNMKTTVDIPDADLDEAMRLTRAKTKKEAIVTAIREFNRKRRMAELVKHAGTCDQLISAEELQSQRRRG